MNPASQPPDILVTRPQPQADQWVRGLQDRGERACALPLIDIGAPASPHAVQEAWAQLAQTHLVMFVSPAAVHWFDRLGPAGAEWPAQTRVAAPGPGTAHAARQAWQARGLQPEQVISPPADSDQFDSEHLWPLLAHHHWSGREVLLISGGDGAQARGRTWLTEQLAAAGARVRTVLTYERRASLWTPAQQACAEAAWQRPQEHVWLFSSSEAVAHLHDRMGPAPALARALATHPKVAQTAHACGFRHIAQTRPDLDAVVQARRRASPWPLDTMKP